MFDELLKTLLKSPLFEEVLGRLTREIPQELTYHTAEHTRDVIKEALSLGQTDALSRRELELLAYAALFHDLGYLQGAEDHEERGARAAAEQLAKATQEKRALFTAAEIECICQMIRDTRMLPEPASPSQHASTPLAGYLLDADVANFGRDDFAEKLERARRELNAGREEFNRQTLALLERHQWLTAAAKRKFAAKKAENAAWLRNQLSGSATRR